MSRPQGRASRELTASLEVRRLLDAARAPSDARELAGERAAVAAFERAQATTGRAARSEPSQAPAARTGLRAALAAAGAVSLLSSGVALAATGHVPFAGAIRQVARQVLGQGGDSGGQVVTHTGPGSARAAGAPGKKRSQAAVLHTLCRAYVHGRRDGTGPALQHRPYAVLVTAAGGRDQVASFCATLPSSGDGHAAPTRATPSNGSTQPTHPVHPTHPTHPATGPSGGPSTRPTHPSHPTHSPKPSPTHQPKPTHTPSAPPTHQPKPTHTATPSHPTHTAHVA